MKTIFFILLFASVASAQIKPHGVAIGKNNDQIKTLVPHHADSGKVLMASDSLHDPSWQTVSGGGGSGTQICEIPSGVENDTNTAFTISHIPVSDTTTDFEVYRNGLHLNPFTHSGWGSPDYVLSGTTITLTVAPSPSDIILTRYRY